MWFVYLHSKNESFASKPLAVAANDVWLDEFRDRFHSVDRNDGIGKSKFIPLSTEVRLIRRCDNKLVIVGKFAENEEIGELFWPMEYKNEMIVVKLAFLPLFFF